MNRENLKFVIVGHVDHGKSSLIGRLLADTNSLLEGQIEKVKKICKDKGKDFEYAFLLDALQEEQEQGITIDTTKIEFSTGKRDYTIIDAPGHKEFLKNMVSGASNAEAAILIVDAFEGVKEQSKRHAFILSLLGIKQIQVVINKMDLVGFSQDKFEKIKEDIDNYLKKLNIFPKKYIPISARFGDNVSKKSENIPWYSGETVLEAIDSFEKEKSLNDSPLRFVIQDIYKFDDKRIIAGKIESGAIKLNENIIISPSQKNTKVKSIEFWKEKDRKDNEVAGKCTGITIEDEFFLKRGEVISSLNNKPLVSNFLKCNIFWMGKNDLMINKTYKLKLNTQEVECEVYAVNNAIDSNTLNIITSKNSISKHEVGNLIIKTKEPIVFDPFDEIHTTGRFVIVDGYDVCGGGIIEKSIKELTARTDVATKSSFIFPKTSLVQLNERIKRYGHKNKVIWLTGMPGCGKEIIAKHLEKELFSQGKNVYYLDASNLRLSLSSDLTFSEESRHEQTRRVAEVANILLNAGFIVIVSIVSPFKRDREYARKIIGESNFIEIFVNTPIEICRENNPKAYSTEKPAYEKSDYKIYFLDIKENDFKLDEKISQINMLLEKELQ